MAALSQFVADNTHVGQVVAVKAKKFVWVTVGQGEVKSYSDFDVDIAGKINVLGYNGDLKIRLELLDKDLTAASGVCSLQLNTHKDEAAVYQANNGALTVTAVFGDKKQGISIRPCNNGAQTECVLSGHVSQTVHLDPG
ncbi:MAG: hypothetical protein KC441_10240 [Anaerolineales bacterium]|nr:hypothetical protein [Anaerolineales bacterium]